MVTQVRRILDMNAFDLDQQSGFGGDLLAQRLRNAGASAVLFYDQPIEMVRGHGCWMEAADGTQYLDFYNNVPSVGHSHPVVTEAVAEQISTLNINSRYLNRRTEHYVDRLKATLPVHLENVVLTCTGSEANDLALRLARTGTGRHGIIVTETAYHGNTSATTEISPSAFKAAQVPPHVRVVPAPSAANYGEDITGGFTAAVQAGIARLNADGHGCSAFICDSVFSSDGVFSHPAGLLQPVATAVHEAGAYVIADEVQPGFARTGEAFWGFDRHGIAPDLVTMGKPMGNGYPIGGVASRPELVSAFCAEVGYFNTFGGTPVAAAAGEAVLDVIAQEGLEDNARTVGSYLRSRLRELANRDPRVADVRGAGLFIGIDLGAPATDGSAEADPDLARALIQRLRDHRVLIGAAGPYGNTLKVRPPLSLSHHEADFFMDALADALASQPAG